jgi:hypothetical protein
MLWYAVLFYPTSRRKIYMMNEGRLVAGCLVGAVIVFEERRDMGFL